MFKNVLVTTDGSARAEKAAAYAIDLARNTGGSLHVISVVNEDKPRNAGEIDPDFYEEIVDSPNVDTGALELKRKKPEMEFAGRIAEQASQQGVEASTVVRVGNPAEEIVSAASDLGADVIVVGSHGRGAAAAALMGSVATNIIHKGDVPVLVIPVHGEE
ncbi:MAG: universal stress protein [Gaiellales bacterium]|nr:MAG: universal stress protein [Gaiellales bacterium]